MGEPRKIPTPEQVLGKRKVPTPEEVLGKKKVQTEPTSDYSVPSEPTPFLSATPEQTQANQSQGSLESESQGTIEPPKPIDVWGSVPSTFQQLSETTGGESNLPTVNPFISKGNIQGIQNAIMSNPAMPPSVNLYTSQAAKEVMRSYNRGAAQGLIATNVKEGQDVQRIAQLQKVMKENSSEGSYKEFIESKDIGSALKVFAKDPVGVLSNLTIESLSAQGGSIGAIDEEAVVAGGTTGSMIPFIGTAAGSMAGMAANSSMALETSSYIMESLAEQGYDTENPEDLKRAFTDAELMENLKSEGQKRGIPVAVFDALSAGIAGKLGGRSIVSKVVRETGTQSALGAAGEASKQLINDGGISNPVAILAEGLGEIGGGAPEIVTGMIANKPELLTQPSTQKTDDFKTIDVALDDISQDINEVPEWVKPELEQKAKELLQKKNQLLIEQADFYNTFSEADQDRISEINNRLGDINDLTSQNLKQGTKDAYKVEANKLLEEKLSIENKYLSNEKIEGQKDTQEVTPQKAKQENTTTPSQDNDSAPSTLLKEEKETVNGETESADAIEPNTEEQSAQGDIPTTEPLTETPTRDSEKPQSNIKSTESSTGVSEPTLDTPEQTETSKPKTTVKKVKSLKGAEYDVEQDEKGNVVSIKSNKDGREIPKFVEAKRKNGTKYLRKNANYSKIESDALGIETENQANERRKAQVRNFEPTNEYEAALDYIASGNKINPESASRETGENKKEMKWIGGFGKEKDLPSIEKAAETIWQTTGKEMDVQEIRNALIDILNSNSTIETVRDKVIELTEESNQKREREEMNAYLGSLSLQELDVVEAQMAEDAYLEELSEEEKTEYYEKQYREKDQAELDELRRTDRESEGGTKGVQESKGGKEIFDSKAPKEFEEITPAQRKLEEQRAKSKEKIKEVRDNFKQGFKEYMSALDEKRKAEKLQAKEITNSVREHLKEVPQGLLTSKQAANLAKRAATVNTPRQLEKFKEYSDRVFERANYLEVLSEVQKKQKRAKARMKGNYFGADNGAMRMALKTNASDLSLQELDDYNSFLTNLNTKAYNPVQNQDTVSKFSDISAKQQEETQSDIKEPKDTSPQKEAEAERKEFYTSALKQAIKEPVVAVEPDYESQYDEIRAIKQEDLENLSSRDVEELLQAYENIKNGYSGSGKAIAALRQIESERGKRKSLSVTSDRQFKNLLRDSLVPFKYERGVKKMEMTDKFKKYLSEIPLNRLDSMLKGVKGNELYRIFIQPAALGYGKFIGDYDTIEKKFTKLYSKVGKGKKDRAKEMIKLSLIAIDKEYKNNPNNKEVSELTDYIEAVKKAAKNNESYGKLANNYLEVYDSMLVDGKFDYEIQESKLSPASKALLEYTEQINERNGRKVEVSAMRNGENITVRKYYTPISVKVFDATRLDEIQSEANQFGSDENLKGTAQSGNIKARTKGGKPIYLEFDENFKSATRSVLQDYHLREPLRRISQTLNKIKSDTEVSTEEMSFYTALGEILSKITRNTFVNNHYDPSGLRKLWNIIKKRGYQMDLASVPRSGIEFSSNFAHAYIANREAFDKGLQFLGRESKEYPATNDDLRELARLAETTQFTRLFEKSQSIIAEPGSNSTESSTLYGRAIDMVNDKLVSLPDRIVAKPLWIGSFIKEFESLSGEKLDIQKFISDAQYRAENKTAVKKARDIADSKLSQGFASLNPYEGIVASQVVKDDGFFQTFNKYMTRFMKFEYQSAVDAYEGMMGRNELTRKEAGLLGAATLVRMAMYQSFLGVSANFFYRMIEEAMGTAQDDEEKEDVGQKMTNSLFGSVLSLFAFRRLGNWAKLPLAYGIEQVNKLWGDELGLRDSDKEYDSFDHSIVFSPIPVEDGAYNLTYDKMIPKLAGPYGKIAKTATRAGKGIYYVGIPNPVGEGYLMEPNASTQETIDRYENELKKRIIPELYMELFGLPAPRDIRNLLLRDVFKDYRKEEVKKSSGRGRSDSGRGDSGR